MAVSLSGMTLYTDNDNESGWVGTDGPDAYNKAVQGSNSESWTVSKNATETGTLTKSATLNATRGLFTFNMASDLSFYYTSIDLELQSSSGNYKNFECANATNKAIGGDFIPSAIDYVNKGTETGAFVPGSLATTRIIIDNSSSGNIRSVVNNWVDAMWHGPGHTISGTTTGDKLYEESAAVDQHSDYRYGIIWNYNGVNYCQGDLDEAGTSLVSVGETLVFIDTVNGYDTYNHKVTGTVSHKDVTVIADGTVAVNFDTSAATSYSKTGGAYRGDGTNIFASGQTIEDVVFTDRGASTVPNTPKNCTFNTSDKITITGELDGCTINKSTATEATSAANTNKVNGCTIIKDTADSHAFELTGAAGSYTWNSTATGYDAGTVGSDVAKEVGVDATGNEHVLITAASGTFTISVADGATTPSVAVASGSTAVVNVVAGQKTLTVTGFIDGSSEVRVRDGSVTLTGGYQDNATAPFTMNFDAYPSANKVKLQISTPGYDYITKEISLYNADVLVDVTTEMIPDPSWVPTS